MNRVIQKSEVKRIEKRRARDQVGSGSKIWLYLETGGENYSNGSLIVNQKRQKRCRKNERALFTYVDVLRMGSVATAWEESR